MSFWLSLPDRLYMYLYSLPLHISDVKYQMSHVMRRMSCVKQHISNIQFKKCPFDCPCLTDCTCIFILSLYTCQMSHVMCHMSTVTFFLDWMMKLVGAELLKRKDTRTHVCAKFSRIWAKSLTLERKTC